MTVLGAHTPAGLARCDVLIRGDLRTFCADRGIDTAAARHSAPSSTDTLHGRREAQR